MLRGTEDLCPFWQASGKLSTITVYWRREFLGRHDFNSAAGTVISQQLGPKFNFQTQSFFCPYGFAVISYTLRDSKCKVCDELTLG